MRSIGLAVRILLAIALAGLGLALPGVQARGRLTDWLHQMY